MAIYEKKYVGSNYKAGISNKEIAKKIREFIKKNEDLNQCEWSITSNHLEINVCLMEAPFEPIIQEYAELNNWWKNHHEMQNVDRGNEDRLTKKAQNLINKLSNFIKSYHMDNSDSMIDYFETNFYYSVNIGKYEKPFRIREKKELQIEPINCDGVQIIEYSEKSVAVIGDTKSIKDMLKELGGRFNMRLSCGAGWIFPKTKEEELRKALSL